MNLETKQYDLAVIGSTPGGIAMAVRAAREGLRVILTNYHPHPGGLLSSGLAVWDTLYEGRRSPIYDEARRAIMEYYRITYGEHSETYKEALPGKEGHTNGTFEARVAEKIFSDLIAAEPNITFLTPYDPISVEKQGRTVTSVTVQETGGPKTHRICASVFADCTYEGDLMARAGTGYRVGRESRDEYGEPHAGRIFTKNNSVGTAPPTDPALAAEIASLNIRQMGGPQYILDAPGSGNGDGLVQAMNYRTMLSSDPENQILPTKPKDYDPAYLATLNYYSFVPVPNRKIGWNRPQLIGLQTDYVEADWNGRQRILDAHWETMQGLLYYLQNDAPSEETRAMWSQYGLARDEFTDHGHRPYEIYVREARRLEGREVYTEHNGRFAPGISRSPIVSDSVAIAEWYFDTHSCTLDQVEGSMDEGKMILHQETLPGQISWRCLLPRDLDNLLVPICISASHVAWGGVRLEPTWMQLAESAAWAAVLAHRQGCAPAEIDSDTLLRTLAGHGIMLAFFNDVDVASGAPWVPAVEYFATKGFFPTYNSRPDELLTEAVAIAWLQILEEMKLPEFAPTRAAASVAMAEAQDSSSASISTLHRLLGPECAATGLSRSEACRLLFAKL